MHGNQNNDVIVTRAQLPALSQIFGEVLRVVGRMHPGQNKNKATEQNKIIKHLCKLLNPLPLSLSLRVFVVVDLAKADVFAS